MKNFSVTLPIAGTITVEVEANSEEEAIREALMSDWPKDSDGCPIFDELEAYEHLTQGNVLYAPVNEPYAEEIE